MKYNQLGHSNLEVSEMGLGCMSLGTEARRAEQIIHHALDQGVNFLDTADLYDQGRNEEIVGQAIRGRRSNIIVATKVGNRFTAGQPGWRWDPSKDYILQAVDQSLKRLGTDYIDLYQLHGGTLDDPIDETIEAFEQLVAAGKIRCYGISSIRPNVIRTYVEKSNIVSVMSQFSILDRRPEETVFPLLQNHGISVIGRGPLAHGRLSRRGLHEPAAEETLGYTSEQIRELVQKLHQRAQPIRQVTDLAIQFCLSHPVVATVIPGASQLEQLQENLTAIASDALSEDELRLIREWSIPNVYTLHR